jgi:hypothetical protein
MHDHAMMVNADARAQGMVSGMKVGGTRRPRTRASEITSANVRVIHADGRVEYRSARSFRDTSTRTRVTHARVTRAHKRDLILQATMRSIHDGGAHS